MEFITIKKTVFSSKSITFAKALKVDSKLTKQEYNRLIGKKEKKIKKVEPKPKKFESSKKDK